VENRVEGRDGSTGMLKALASVSRSCVREGIGAAIHGDYALPASHGLVCLMISSPNCARTKHASVLLPITLSLHRPTPRAPMITKS